MAHADEYSISTAETPAGIRGDFELPSRLRLLCISAEEPSWVRLTLQLDASGCHEPYFRWISKGSEALALLRESSFDCLFIQSGTSEAGATEVSAASLLRAIRGSGSDDPVVIFSAVADDELATVACLEGAELLVSPAGFDSNAVIPTTYRAMHRVEVDRENHRLASADRRRLSHERDEAVRLLEQQRQIISSLEILEEIRTPAPELRVADEQQIVVDEVGATEPTAARPNISLPEELDDYYQELLRTYVIMGSGNLGQEIARLARLLSELGLSPRQSLQLHLGWVERLVTGLGSRSARHVMSRADLLALELMIHLGECYQQANLDGDRRAA